MKRIVRRVVLAMTVAMLVACMSPAAVSFVLPLTGKPDASDAKTQIGRG